MKKAHTDEEIIAAAETKKSAAPDNTDDKVDIAVDLDDENGIAHTYVVTFLRKPGGWTVFQVNELSSL